MQAGEVGVDLQVFPNATNPAPAQPVSLTGLTCSLELQSPTGVRSSLPMTPSVDGTFCSRTTTANDFPSAGNWTYQLKVVDGGGTLLLLSKATELNIGKAL